ncbi:glycosyltransferase family 2 protein [Sphingobacterium sp. B29]|uniref:glycosyltransferase family 2 protein n=1 Tax=Sphingobacterium sp. B29 TaxID=1933220 RepID=UPI0012F9B3F6|nr:glycosyltransferase family A protein [Sphingobacterium sp. B29]
MINQFVKPLVSIVIPCYNCENTIEEAIGSALSQTYTNIEVIVVNDGSVDNSESIVAELIKGDSRLSIYSQTNKGVSAVRNLGLRVARGSFIVFLDGDDKLKDSYIDLGVNIFEKKPSLTLVYSNMELFERESGPFPLAKFNLKIF